jgi:large subunit ribosomal protein L2
MYNNKETAYIMAPYGIKVNDEVASGAKAEPKPGNTLPLQHIPEGTLIYNLERKPADGGKMVRSAGTTATVVTVTKDQVMVLLPSKKEVPFSPNCRATIGVIAGGGRSEKPFVKAGKRHYLMRARGKLYPLTSGVAMNAVDHPFGCGRGRHVGKPKTVGQHAPPGAKVGKVRARRTGRRVK